MELGGSLKTSFKENNFRQCFNQMLESSSLALKMIWLKHKRKHYHGPLTALKMTKPSGQKVSESCFSLSWSLENPLVPSGFIVCYCICHGQLNGHDDVSVYFCSSINVTKNLKKCQQTPGLKSTPFLFQSIQKSQSPV